MKSFLKIQSLPYLLSLLVFLFGWSLNRVISTIYTSPTLEYSIAQMVDNSGAKIQLLTVTNISKNVLFKDVVFNFEAPRGKPKSKFLYSNIYGVSHSYRGNWVKSDGTYFADFTIPEIHPMSSYKLVIKYVGRPPIMTYNSEKQAILLQESSLTTWAVKNEFLINCLLILLWSVLIGIYLFFIREKQ